MTVGINSAPALAAVQKPVAARSDTCAMNILNVIARGTTVARDTPLRSELVAKLDEAVRSALLRTPAPGVIVGVVSPEGTWKAAYGIADPVKRTPMTVDMHTRIGSVTKTFTVTVILQLAEAGTLSLDDKIGQHIPGVPNGDRITLRQLANMTSGLASYTQNEEFTDQYFAKPQTIWAPTNLLSIGVADSPLFEPGSSFNYSNTNTVLLGLVIEKVTKKPIGQILKKQILDRLSLSNTVWPGDSTAMPTPYARGFTLQGIIPSPGTPVDATHWNPSWGWTAGEMISNVDDLLVYARALGTGRGMLGTKFQSERLKFSAAGGYGLGMGCADGWVGHSGELPGYNTTVHYHTGEDIAVVVQTNSDIASGDCEEKPTMTDDPRDTVCSSPAKRVLVAVSSALGHPYRGP